MLYNKKTRKVIKYAWVVVGIILILGTPELLLLDEPSVGVDPISRRELMKICCLIFSILYSSRSLVMKIL